MPDRPAEQLSRAQLDPSAPIPRDAGWAELGWVDAFGDPAPADEASPPERVPGTVAATLDAIDAAVGHLCACGCRRSVDQNGPSAYFASQGCQRRWHSARTDDPDAVYARPDPDEASIMDAVAEVLTPAEPAEGRLAYRPRCPRCRLPVDTTSPAPAAGRAGGHGRRRCVGCGADAGLADATGTVRQSALRPGAWHLELSTGAVRGRRTISIEGLDDDVATARAERAWSQLEDQLARFCAVWIRSEW